MSAIEPDLLELAADIAGKPELWAADVSFDDNERYYVSLYRDAHVDVWVLCWTPVSDTGWHDHDISSGAVAVAFGTLVEHTQQTISRTGWFRGPGGALGLTRAPGACLRAERGNLPSARCDPAES